MKACTWFRQAGAALLAAAMLPAAAAADVTVERYTKGGGIAGVGAHEVTATEKISGQRKRELSQMKLAGGLGSFINKVAGDMGGDTITDIGKDAVWTLNHKERTYTERRIVPPAMPGEEGGPGGGPGDAAYEESDEEGRPNVRVVRNEITVEETGEKKKIGKFDAQRAVVTWILETEDLETKERGESRMVMDLWNAPETKELKTLQKEEMEFAKAYFKKLGWDLTDQQTQKLGMAAVAGMLGGDQEGLEKGMKEVAKKLEKIKGFPVGTRVAWYVKQTGGAAARQREEPTPSMPEIAKELGGLFGKLGKKKGGDGGAAKPGGEPPVFESYTEIRSVSIDGIPDAEFQVPSGYRKVAE